MDCKRYRPLTRACVSQGLGSESSGIFRASRVSWGWGRVGMKEVVLSRKWLGYGEYDNTVQALLSRRKKTTGLSKQ